MNDETEFDNEPQPEPPSEPPQPTPSEGQVPAFTYDEAPWDESALD